MSALVESMFYAGREVPWHGLGKQLDEAPNSKTAIIEAGLDWCVDSNPIYDANGNVIEGFKANTRDNDNSVLGIVTDRYKIVQNAEAFEFTDSLIDSGEVRYETAGSLRDGKTVWLLAKMEDSKILGDDFDNYICFANSHDGSGAVKVCMTNTRVVCNNTLNLALSNATRIWSTKHLGDIKGKLAEAKRTLGLAKEYTLALDEEADRLANIKVSDEELEVIFDSLFPIDYEKDTARKIANIKELKANIFKCYEAEDIKKFKGTAWGVMNAISDTVCHSAPARMTATYQQNNWGKIMNGHPLMDNFYKAVKGLNKVA